MWKTKVATMNSIWHNPPQTPDVFKSHPIIVVYEAGDQIEQMDSKEYSDLVGERYVNRWCYVDDLIKENDRTRKALEVAVKSIKLDKDFAEYMRTELGREHKKLEIAVDTLKYIRRTNPLSFHFEAIEKALEQIKEKEQQ